MGCSLGKQLLRPGACDADPLALTQAIRRLEAEVQQLKKEGKTREEIRETKIKFELGTKQHEDEEEESLQKESKSRDWSHVLVQQKQRDEAAEKWKRLYLSIKNELDQLIQATALISLPQAQGEQMLCINWLKEELKAKEAINKELKAKVVAMERESANLEREVDILRQSLRIMSNNRIKQQ